MINPIVLMGAAMLASQRQPYTITINDSAAAASLRHEQHNKRMAEAREDRAAKREVIRAAQRAAEQPIIDAAQAKRARKNAKRLSHSEKSK